MRREVMGPEISLDLDDAADALHAVDHAHQVLAEELPRDQHRVAVVEGPRQLPQRYFSDITSRILASMRCIIGPMRSCISIIDFSITTGIFLVKARPAGLS